MEGKPDRYGWFEKLTQGKEPKEAIFVFYIQKIQVFFFDSLMRKEISFNLKEENLQLMYIKWQKIKYTERLLFVYCIFLYNCRRPELYLHDYVYSFQDSYLSFSKETIILMSFIFLTKFQFHFHSFLQFFFRQISVPSPNNYKKNINSIFLKIINF